MLRERFLFARIFKIFHTICEDQIRKLILSVVEIAKITNATFRIF
jgi:hypothetical protein